MSSLSATSPALGVNCPTGVFIQAASVPSGNPGSAVGIAPIDADATLDIVVVASSNGTVSVLLGNGDGTFAPPIVIPIGYDAISVAVGDLNGDTKPDLVIGTYSEVLVLLGHGDGTFDTPVEYFVNAGAIYSVILARLDGNVSLDIAAIGSNINDHIFVLLGNGDGTFAPSVTYPAGDTRGLALASGDFNGDGHLDLAAAGWSTVSVLLGAGDGTFGPAQSFLAGVNLSGIAAADLDGDGHLDLAISSGLFLSILAGNGDGTFQAALQYPTDVGPGKVALADFDVDGALDVVVSAPVGGYYGVVGGVALLRGRGDGSFGPAETYQASANSNGLAVGDLDQDGLPDVVTLDAVSQAVSVLFDNGAGDLYAASLSPLAEAPSYQFAQGDFDGDGRPDLAWIEYTTLVIASGSPDGRFRPSSILSTPNSQGLGGVASGDFTGDGRVDLVTNDYSDVWLFRAQDDGTFASPTSIFSSFALGTVLVADFDGNGSLDVVVNQVCCGSTLNVLLNNGDGTFGSPVQTSLDSDNTALLIAADLTQDAKADLVVTNASQGVKLLPGNGDGSFGIPVILDPNPAGGFAAFGDFDGQAGNDLLFPTSTSNIELFLADGSGGFQSPVLIGLGAPAVSLVVGDFDGNSKLDFGALSSSVLIFLGLGNGHFQSPLVLLGGQSNTLLAVGDYDGNGAPDLVTGGSTLTTFLNARLGAKAPSDLSVVIGSPAVLAATAGGGFGPIDYQWRKNGTPLSDGGAISGATTATLTIDPVSFADAGSYDVLVTDSCGQAASNTATLSVEFADVPVSSPFHADILTIATAGIAAGCGGGNYCPTSPVRRDQMAVFLLKSEHGSAYTPPACSGVFADLPCPGPFADWVEQLAAEGVTGGCGGGNYCPDSPVTRAQMAVFLLKTKNGSSYIPPAATGIFGDVPIGSFAADFIEALYNQGITGGCQASPLLYCPNNPVLRQQMATFLVRTFSL